MSTLCNLIEEARARGVRDIADLPFTQRRRMIALAIPDLESADILSGVDTTALVAALIMAKNDAEWGTRKSELTREIYAAYMSAATRYINEELNNGK